MKHVLDRAIILTRRDYGERDRILVVLGMESGKATLIAKSVRTSKSKLAGGIELFSESDMGYVLGKGSMHTLTAARLHMHYGQIAQDIDRTMAGYDFLKLLNKTIEDTHGQEYYPLLAGGLAGLNDPSIPSSATKAWFGLNVLQSAGHMPSLMRDRQNNSLPRAESYSYDFDHHCFTAAKDGRFKVENIKLLRVLASTAKVPKIDTDEEILKHTAQLVDDLVKIQL